MSRQQTVLRTFNSHFEKHKNEKILIYGKGLYTKLLVENFREYSFLGIIDRLDLEGYYCGLPILKYEDVIKSGAKIIIIAANIENTELIRKRIGNFCIRNQIKLYSVDGRCLNIDDCVMKVTEHPSHGLSRENLREEIKKRKTVCIELNALLLEKSERFVFREEIIKDIYWIIKRNRNVILLIRSYDDKTYEFFHAHKFKWERELTVREIGQSGIYYELIRMVGRTDKEDYLYIGIEGVAIAEEVGVCTYPIYSPLEMLANSTYNEICGERKNKEDNIYMELLAERLFSSPYALNHTRGKVHIKKAYDIGYVFLGPIVMDFMFWFVQKIREYEIEQVIFSARDGYLFQRLYKIMAERLELTDLPDSVYFYTSRRVCNLARIYDIGDVEKQAGEYFKGSVQEMLLERFMLDRKTLDKHDRNQYDSDIAYVRSFGKDILNKAEEVRENYRIYIDSLLMKENAIFFDLFASGSCQLTLEKMNGKRYKGLYFSRYWTDDEEKLKLDIEGFVEFDQFMGDHSMFMESILTSTEPTLCYVDAGGKLCLGKETRSEAELAYIRETQQGVIGFVLEVLQYLKKIPEKGQGYGKRIFELIVSKYTQIDNDIFKSMIIRDEILHRNQYLGDFYKY